MMRRVRPAFYQQIVALLIALAPVAAQADERTSSDLPKCADIASIGAATMAADGIITMRIRTLPPGPVAEGQFTYKPGDRDYQSTLDHLGGLAPGETKPVKPWC